MRFALANRARGMQKESTFARQQQSVHNAQDRIDRVRIRRLPHFASARVWVPLREKIAALELPVRAGARYRDVRVGVGGGCVGEFDVELKLRLMVGGNEI